MIGFLTIIISFFPLFHFSLKNCPYSTPLAIKINLNDSLSGKQNCLNDETCCFMRVQYSEYVGGFQGTACLPVDYEKNTEINKIRKIAFFISTFAILYIIDIAPIPG